MNQHERRRRGEAGEAFFRDWLERSGLPYVTVDQDRASFPRHLKHAIKRPDFEVGVPTLGRVAVEVKHKTVYHGDGGPHVYLDVSEIERLDNYEDAFATVVWWFLKDPEGKSCWLVQNRTVAHLLPDEPDRAAPVKLPLGVGSPARPATHGFLEALAFAAGVSRSSACRRSSPRSPAPQNRSRPPRRADHTPPS